jgi:hypothetical protein
MGSQYVFVNESVKLDDSTGSITAIGGHLNAATINIDSRTVEAIHLETTSVITSPSVYGWSIDLSGYLDGTVADILIPFSLSTSVSKTFDGRLAHASGKMYLQGETFMDGQLQLSGEVGEFQMFSCSLKGNGNLTRTSIAAS